MDSEVNLWGTGRRRVVKAIGRKGQGWACRWIYSGTRSNEGNDQEGVQQDGGEPYKESWQFVYLYRGFRFQ